MYRLIPTVVSFALLRLCSQTLAADHNLIPRQATTCDPTQPAPTANPDGSLNTFTISVINPILPGPTFVGLIALFIWHLPCGALETNLGQRTWDSSPQLQRKSFTLKITIEILY